MALFAEQMPQPFDARAPGSRWPYWPIVGLIRQAIVGGGVAFVRIPRLLLLLLRFTLLEPFRLCERIFYDRKILAHSLSHDPIFILGHWRSGTSYLQELLQQDPALCTSTIFRSAFADVFFTTESWLKPFLSWLARLVGARYHIQRVAMDFDLPAESDPALTSLGSPHSYSWGHLFPRDFTAAMQRTVFNTNPDATHAWLAHLDYLARKLSLRSGGKRVVVKSPGDTARLSELAERYPNARFIYIHRDPVHVFHSNRYLWEQVVKHVSLQTLAPEERDAVIVSGYQRLVSTYLQQRNLVSQDRLVEIKYEQLASNPVSVLAAVYKRLDLGVFPERELQAFVNSRSAYRPVSVPSDSELEARLKLKWNFAYEPSKFALQDPLSDVAE